MTYSFRVLCPVKKYDRFLKSFSGEPDKESNVYESKTTKEARRKPNVERQAAGISVKHLNTLHLVDIGSKNIPDVTRPELPHLELHSK